MIAGLISLLIVIIVVGLVAGIIVWLIDMLPLEPPPIKQFARVIVIVIALLIILARALPLLGVAV